MRRVGNFLLKTGAIVFYLTAFSLVGGFAIAVVVTGFNVVLTGHQ